MTTVSALREAELISHVDRVRNPVRRLREIDEELSALKARQEFGLEILIHELPRLAGPRRTHAATATGLRWAVLCDRHGAVWPARSDAPQEPVSAASALDARLDREVYQLIKEKTRLQDKVRHAAQPI